MGTSHLFSPGYPIVTDVHLDALINAWSMEKTLHRNLSPTYLPE